jgi:YhcH/YjgK/YiaL family protein
MILDTLNNIDIYKEMSKDIYAGLIFISNAETSIGLGEYIINNKVKAIVSEYETISNFHRGYESHKKVIDIQYPIVGLERIKWSPIREMTVNIPYDPERDRTFFLNPSIQGTNIDIGNGIFAIMFPEDGHSPQHFIDKPQKIKKITVKISI